MFYQLSNMLPQIFRVSSTLTLTSSKHWWIGRHYNRTRGDLLNKNKTLMWSWISCYVFWGFFCSFFWGRVSKWIFKEPTHKRHSFQQDSTWASTWSCKRYSIMRQCQLLSSPKRHCKCFLDSVGFQSSCWNYLQTSRVHFWWQTFMTLWHQPPLLATIPVFPFEAAMSACSSHSMMQNLASVKLF